jgi:hypothetical protein
VKRIFIALALLAVALIVAIWRAPASLVAGVLPSEVSRLVQLHQATGTIWRGSALFSVTGVPPSLSLAWQCRPSLAPLGLRCELSESLSALVTVDVFANKLIAERVTASLPVQVTAAGAATATSPNVVASFSEIMASRSALSIKGNLRASDARYRFGNTEASLGELTVECAPSADAANANATSTCTISNRGGNARLDGKVALGSSKASGTLELTPANGPAQRVNF